LYDKEVKTNSKNQPSADEILTEKDIAHLPPVVQKYLKYVGVVSKPKVNNFKAKMEGEMKLGMDKDWTKVEVEQTSFLEKPTRLFYIKARMFGLPVTGRDKYENGKGNMLIKIAGLIKVADAKDVRMDEAARVTHFNDMCLMAPATLIDKRITWKVINELSVEATFEDKGMKVSAVLDFNEKGELINFTTNNRYYSPTGKTYENIPWSTPCESYGELGGLTMCTRGKAIWHFPDKDFEYGRMQTKSIELNKY